MTPKLIRQAARVKTYGDVLSEYEYHPEAKCADGDGSACDKQTVGLLQRRHIRIDQMKYIGKESNSLEEVESGLKRRVWLPEGQGRWRLGQHSQPTTQPTKCDVLLTR